MLLVRGARRMLEAKRLKELTTWMVERNYPCLLLMMTLSLGKFTGRSWPNSGWKPVWWQMEKKLLICIDLELVLIWFLWTWKCQSWMVPRWASYSTPFNFVVVIRKRLRPFLYKKYYQLSFHKFSSHGPHFGQVGTVCIIGLHLSSTRTRLYIGPVPLAIGQDELFGSDPPGCPSH